MWERGLVLVWEKISIHGNKIGHTKLVNPLPPVLVSETRATFQLNVARVSVAIQWDQLRPSEPCALSSLMPVWVMDSPVSSLCHGVERSGIVTRGLCVREVSWGKVLLLCCGPDELQSIVRGLCAGQVQKGTCCSPTHLCCLDLTTHACLSWAVQMPYDMLFTWFTKGELTNLNVPWRLN